MISTFRKMIRFIQGCRNRSEKPNLDESQNEEVSQKESEEVDVSFSINDELGQRVSAFSQNPNTFILNKPTHRNLIEEDEKQDNKSLNKTMMK